MKRILAAAAIMASFAFAATGSQAAPASPLTGGSQIANSSITRVDWDDWGHGRRCHHWRHECAERWPALGWRFHRCAAVHGCGW
jgi:hypothetical protein